MTTQHKPRIRVYGAMPTGARNERHNWAQLLLPTAYTPVSWRQVDKAATDADWCAKYRSLASGIQASIVVEM